MRADDKVATREVGHMVCEALGLDTAVVARTTIVLDPSGIVTAHVKMYPTAGQLAELGAALMTLMEDDGSDSQA